MEMLKLSIKTLAFFVAVNIAAILVGRTLVDLGYAYIGIPLQFLIAIGGGTACGRYFALKYIKLS